MADLCSNFLLEETASELCSCLFAGPARLASSGSMITEILRRCDYTTWDGNRSVCAHAGLWHISLATSKTTFAFLGHSWWLQVRLHDVRLKDKYLNDSTGYPWRKRHLGMVFEAINNMVLSTCRAKKMPEGDAAVRQPIASSRGRTAASHRFVTDPWKRWKRV